MAVFDPSQIAPYFQFREKVVSLGINVNQQVLPVNPLRIAVMFGSVTAAYTVRPSVAATTTFGFTVPANGAPLILGFADNPGIVGQAWNAISGSGITIYILEQVYQPIAE